jgi:DNA-binding CsgD family transcriptional regulator
VADTHGPTTLHKDNRLSPATYRVILDHLTLAVFVFRRGRPIYVNAAATRLADRVRAKYGKELGVSLIDHLGQVRDLPQPSGPVVTLLTVQGREPFYVHVLELNRRRQDVVVTVRELGTEIGAFRARYRLSAREAQVAELVLHGFRNQEIASTLGIAPATIKKHLTRVYDKVGVDSRVLLANRLA